VIQTPNFDPNNRIEVYLAAILEELREHRKQASEMMKCAEVMSRGARKPRWRDTERLEYAMEKLFIVSAVGPRTKRIFSSREDIDDAMDADALLKKD
jgi:hypothetical protein